MRRLAPAAAEAAGEFGLLACPPSLPARFLRHRAVLLQRRQRRGVFMRVTRRSHYAIVAAILAFGANHGGDPPHGGVVEDQALDEDLEQVNEIVVAADVRQFVEKQRFHLRGRKPGEQSYRHQNDWAQEADNERDVGQAGFKKHDRRGDAQAGREVCEALLPRSGAADAGAAQAARADPAGETARRENGDARDPEGGKPRRPGRAANEAPAPIPRGARRTSADADGGDRRVPDSIGWPERQCRKRPAGRRGPRRPPHNGARIRENTESPAASTSATSAPSQKE